MNAFVFPGQGSQFVGMGKALYEKHPIAKQHFDLANKILGFDITEIMFNGTDEELKQTKVTQPAVFLHSVISALCLGQDFNPEMAAGHSLGELSALTATRCLSFEDGLKLVAARAIAMQKACEAAPGTMAAIIALADDVVEKICREVSEETGETVIPANYNCPGQLVIGGEKAAVDKASALALAAGARRCLPLKVSGPFHTRLMAPAGDALAKRFATESFGEMQVPVLFNCLGREKADTDTIPALLERQVQNSVRMEDTLRRLGELGVTHILEVGPGKALAGFVKKTLGASVVCASVETPVELDAVLTAWEV